MSSNEPAIRTECSDDVEAIDAVLSAAFPTRLEADLVRRLREAGRLVVSLAAELEGEVVGHVAFSPVSIDGVVGNPPALGLAPVAVRPERQHGGIGSQLIRVGLDECRRLGTPFVVVLGEPAFYSRFGFRRADERGIGNLYGVGAEFRVSELVPTALDEVNGTVRYAPEFDALP